MTKKDHRPYNLSLEKASEIIGKLKAGETVTDCPCGENHQLNVNPQAKELVGKIFYESWGYDQTNIDFAIVVSVSPSGKTVMVRMMSEKVVPMGEGYAPMSEHVVPDQPYGEPFRLYVRSRAINPNDVSLVGQYPFCLRPDETLESARQHGAMRMGYFTRWEGKPIYQSHYA